MYKRTLWNKPDEIQLHNNIFLPTTLHTETAKKNNSIPPSYLEK